MMTQSHFRNHIAIANCNQIKSLLGIETYDDEKAELNTAIAIK